MSSMVTLMVKLRKLTGNLITFVAVTRGKSVLQTNGLLEGTSVFGRFWATKSYQISPLFAKNVHRRGSNTALRAGFARPIQLKRVKPSGPCQSVIGAHFAIAKERPTQRHRGTEKNGKHWGARDIFVSSSVSLGLGASVVILHALSRPFRRSAGATANLRGQSVDSTMVDRQFSKSEKHGMLNLKDLLAGLSFHPASVEPDLSGLAGPLKRGAAYLLIPQGLLAELLKRKGEGSLNLKDLLTAFSSSCRLTFSAFVERAKRDEADLLIPQGLLAKCRRRAGEGLLNLKDLLTVLPPSLGRLFENERVLRPLSCAESCQILPFSGENAQIIAENGGFPSRVLGERSAGRGEAGQHGLDQGADLLGAIMGWKIAARRQHPVAHQSLDHSNQGGSHRLGLEVGTKVAGRLRLAQDAVGEADELPVALRDRDLVALFAHAASFQQHEQLDLGIAFQCRNHDAGESVQLRRRRRRSCQHLTDSSVDVLPGGIKDRLQQTLFAPKILHQLGLAGTGGPSNGRGAGVFVPAPGEQSFGGVQQAAPGGARGGRVNRRDWRSGVADAATWTTSWHKSDHNAFGRKSSSCHCKHGRVIWERMASTDYADLAD